MKKLAFAVALTLSFAGAAQAQFLQPTQPAAQAPSGDPNSLNKIVAVVDEDVVLQSELDRAVNQVLAQYQRNPQQLPPRPVLERQVLDRLIMTKLQVAKAEQTGVRIGDVEVDQAIAGIARQNKLDVDQLRAAIARDGISYDEFRRNLHDDLVGQRLRQRVAQSTQATDAEIDILLASNSLKTGEVHLAHILIDVPEGASAEQIAAAREKAEKVKADIDGGLDFAAAAIRSSNGQDALQGGDLGWRRYDEVPAMFADLIQGMAPGQVSPAMRGPAGFHILKLVDKRESSKQVVTEFHALHMMIRVTEVVGVEEAEKKANDLRRRIVEGGEDFGALAKANSQDSTSANNGGDLGWFPIDTYGQQVAEVVSRLKDGEVSEPFRSNVGWHFVKRLGMREQDRTDEARRQLARDAIQQRKAEEEYGNMLRQLRSEAYVEYRLAGFDAEGKPKDAPAASGG
ncbi:peptidylprolyl isomerase [Tahibacter soli]|jgi:peptidyl-prolyl cis-trans isomerase SurA|uniref:Chaperone SurA n=1 Tax=Tahibacter soli TaxID=2983605 RepID=A0A9X4BIU3_9GAMM|nr:peptidylprolyl isomerase [Tahibacter soli]MDC8011489.1 peptidylprolyl isomerase [Tahibacter soli]